MGFSHSFQQKLHPRSITRVPLEESGGAGATAPVEAVSVGCEGFAFADVRSFQILCNKTLDEVAPAYHWRKAAVVGRLLLPRLFPFIATGLRSLMCAVFKFPRTTGGKRQWRGDCSCQGCLLWLRRVRIR